MSPPGPVLRHRPDAGATHQVDFAAVGLRQAWMIRSRVDLPAPLRPNRPTFQPSEKPRPFGQRTFAVTKRKVADVKHGAAAFAAGGRSTGLLTEPAFIRRAHMRAAS